MTEQSWNSWFDAQLDWVANGLPFESPAPKQSNPPPPAALVADLQVAARLANLDLGEESKTRANLRTRLAWMAIARGSIAKKPNRSAASNPLRTAWFAGLATVWLIVCLVVVNQPALTLLEHFLGYGYMPEIGFFSLANTALLKGPVELRQNGHPLLVRQGISLQSGPDGPGATQLWVEGGPQTLRIEEVWLEIPQSSPLPARAIDPDGINRIRLTFASLPAGTSRVVLHLSAGWQHALEWIPAAGAGGLPTQAALPTVLHTPTNMALNDNHLTGDEKAPQPVDLNALRPVPTPTSK
jgi:hypothetical protein